MAPAWAGAGARRHSLLYPWTTASETRASEVPPACERKGRHWRHTRDRARHNVVIGRYTVASVLAGTRACGMGVPYVLVGCAASGAGASSRAGEQRVRWRGVERCRVRQCGVRQCGVR